MKTIDNNYINKLRLPNTSTIVVVNGAFQKELSDQCIGVEYQQQTIKIASSTTIAKPIHILFLVTQDCNYTVDITAEPNSCFTLITEHAELVSHSCSHNVKINITAKDSSRITYYRLPNTNTFVCHNTKTTIKQEQNSKVNSGFIGKGSINLNEALEVKLNGEYANYNSIGIISLNDSQRLSYQAHIEHIAPNCTSNVSFKGVVTDKATGTFDCLVLVHPQATKTQTHVTNKNMLLADTATMNTSPQLEIYTDDITCTHGATVGQLDQEALFYLRSRGLAIDTATKLLVKAFTQEIVDQFAACCQPKINLDTAYEH